MGTKGALQIEGSLFIYREYGKAQRILHVRASTASHG
jgi:hypothetical protein